MDVLHSGGFMGVGHLGLGRSQAGRGKYLRLA